MPSAVFLTELVALPRAARGRPTVKLVVPCMAQLAGTRWERVELPAGGWVLYVEGDALQLARIAAVPGVTRLGPDGEATPGERAAAVAWLRARGVTRSAAQLAQPGGMAAAVREAKAAESRKPRPLPGGGAAWDGPVKRPAREAPEDPRGGKAARRV